MPSAVGPAALRLRTNISGKSIVPTYVTSIICNTFTPQIKGSFYGLNVMHHNHSSPGVLQLPWCATTLQWNVPVHT